MKSKVITKLKELNKIPHLNRGGCAIAALAAHEYATSIGIETEVIYLLNRNTDYISLINNKPATCMHAVIKINNCYYDSNGRVYKKGLYAPKVISVNKKLLIESIKLKEEWNFAFNREKHLPEIDKVIGIPISKLIKE